ncbi:AAA family ATPase [Paenibacillus sp. YYML68]|uniref:AAA family ATPase n=1 Tax=Paenibacillus sp. YYML68 TaxID=2909250 RepID=UPI00249308B4|nr:AAA family ATPase [Paenibacillus sp. YYML68]
MITYLSADNFKGLNNFHIEFEPLTVIIGDNGAGKSTILQVIDFLSDFSINRDLLGYFEKREWNISELKSKLNPNRNINFKLGFKVDTLEDHDFHFAWDVVFTTKKDEIYLVREEIKELNNNKYIMKRDNSKFELHSIMNDKVIKSEEDMPINMSLPFSLLSILNGRGENFPELIHIKNFLKNIKSFELLSTEKMRKHSRGKVDDIGVGGDKLATFLHGLSRESRESVISKVKKYIPYISDIKTKKKSVGWTSFEVVEKYNKHDGFNVLSQYISDGILRILALSALKEIKTDNLVILLDEIEDGINPTLAATLVNDLVDFIESNNRQVIVTSHSPLILNNFNHSQIVIVWKNGDGSIGSAKMFNNDEVIHYLEFMNPGEVWVNFEQSDLLKLVDQEHQWRYKK